MTIRKIIESTSTKLSENLAELRIAATIFSHEHPFKATVCVLYGSLVFPLVLVAGLTLGVFGIAIAAYFALIFSAFLPIMIIALKSVLYAWGLSYLHTWLEKYRPHMGVRHKSIETEKEVADINNLNVPNQTKELRDLNESRLDHDTQNGDVNEVIIKDAPEGAQEADLSSTDNATVVPITRQVVAPVPPITANQTTHVHRSITTPLRLLNWINEARPQLSNVYRHTSLAANINDSKQALDSNNG